MICIPYVILFRWANQGGRDEKCTLAHVVGISEMHTGKRAGMRPLGTVGGMTILLQWFLKNQDGRQWAGLGQVVGPSAM